METVRQADQNCWNGCILGFSELLVMIVGQSDSWIVRQSGTGWKIVGLSNCRTV